MVQQNYRAWELKEADFPSQGSMRAKLRFLLRYAVLAPSVHNTQAWLFSINDDSVSIKANNDITLPENDPESRQLNISLGTCLTNLLLAGEYFGFWADVKEKDDREIIVTFGETESRAGGESVGLFKAIPNRRSNKFPYLPRPVPTETVSKLTDLSDQHANIKVITDRETIGQLSKLHAKSFASVANSKFTKELTSWLRLPNTKSEDGMPAFVVGLSQLQAKIMLPLLARKPALMKVLAKKDMALLKGSPGVIVISTLADKPADWIAAGEIMAKAMLKVTSTGLAIQPMAAMIENGASRQELAEIADLDGGFPQVFLRFGFPSVNARHTPRYDVGKFLPEQLSAIDRLVDNTGLEIERKKINVGPYKINYLVAGKGTPVLLIHGANIGWPQWYNNIPALAQHFTVYAIDLPGAGESSRIDFAKADFNTDFLDIVDKFIELQGWEQVDIVGSSFGGWIAAQLAAKQRPYIRRMVLANPIGFTSFIYPKNRPVAFTPLAKLLSKTVLKPRRTNKNLENFMRDIFADKTQPLLPEFVDYFYELSESSHNLLFISRLNSFKGMAKGLFLPDKLKNIKVPTLFIWGEKDPLTPYDRVKDNFKLVPNMQVKLLPNVGHMPSVEDSIKFNELVINFFSK